MKRFILLAFICLVFITCSKSKDVVLRLSNPQNLSVSFTGYYIEVATGDSISMNGVTLREYEFVLDKGDEITGMVHKDGGNMVDTLHFRVFIDNEEELSQKTTIPSQIIEFQVIGE